MQGHLKSWFQNLNYNNQLPPSAAVFIE
jgi:hypothetical protein